MKKIIQLVVFTLLCVLTINAQNGADSNIIFVDYVPDSVLKEYTDTFNIDINQDGLTDIAFFYSFASSGRYIYYRPYSNSSWLQVYSSYADSLNSPSITWSQGQNVSLYLDTTSYVCIKKNIDQNVFFGWIEIRCDRKPDDNYLTIFKHAFCKIPNYPLTVGQKDTRTSIYELVGSTKSLNIFANPTQGLCTINLPVALSNSAMHLRLYNPLGQLVKETTLAAGLSSTELNLQAFSKGTYTVSISNGNTLYSGQVILE